MREIATHGEASHTEATEHTKNSADPNVARSVAMLMKV